jgi:hypothetical protein
VQHLRDLMGEHMRLFPGKDQQECPAVLAHPLNRLVWQMFDEHESGFES